MAADSHSADVKLRLSIDGVELRLSHVGSKELVAREPCEPVTSGKARLVISVDGHTTVSDVFLPNGVPGPNEPFAYL